MEIRSKKEIRAEVKKHRREATEEQIQRDSDAICTTFLSLPEYAEAEIVFAYMDCKNEVQTKKVIEHCWKNGKKVAVPKVFGEIMKYYVITSCDDLEEGYFGIPEPKYEQLEEVICEDGLMILPGVAFDEQRHRVGYGGGFYDRYLEAHPNMKKIAFAFEFQMFDNVPYEVFDRQPEKIITEKRIII
jgi:5-formyltetrahydrofolate cyclo-ligase